MMSVSDAPVESSVPLVHRIPQACKRIGCGKTTFYELVKAGEIKLIKIGAISGVPESELQRLVATRLQAAA